MKKNTLKTLNHALKWAKDRQRHKVQFEFTNGYWEGDNPSQSIYVYNGSIGMNLEDGFTGDIDKALCEKEQESINAQIVALVGKLEKSKQECI